MKKLLFIILVISGLKSIGQKTDTVNTHTFKSYNEVIKNELMYYLDSISKRLRHKLFFVEVYISQFDTSKKVLKIIMNWNCYYPMIVFNPTHFITINEVTFVIRFGKEINKILVKKFPFEIISSEKIKNLKKMASDYAARNHFPTGYTQPLVFSLNSNMIKYTWYLRDTDLPIDELCVDLDYMKSHAKYEVYLAKKLKEYGYK